MPSHTLRLRLFLFIEGGFKCEASILALASSRIHFVGFSALRHEIEARGY